MNFALIFSLVAFLWSLAVLGKLGSCALRREPYRFAQWDGGLVLRGQTIGRVGSSALAVFCIACAGFAVYLLVAMGRL